MSPQNRRFLHQSFRTTHPVISFVRPSWQSSFPFGHHRLAFICLSSPPFYLKLFLPTGQELPVSFALTNLVIW